MRSQKKIVKINDVCYSLGIDWVVQLEVEGIGRIVIKGKTISELSDVVGLTDNWHIEQLKGCYVWVDINEHGIPQALSHLTRDLWVKVHRYNG